MVLNLLHLQIFLTFTILRANSADDRFMFSLLFPEDRLWCFMQIVS